MFEKEALNYGYHQTLGISVSEMEQSAYDWQKGAEFGYNKANEWHYVKDGDLPKEDIYLILRLNEDYEGVRLGQNICDVWKHLAQDLETLRLLYVQTGDEIYFIELVRLLPSSYKVVKL